jgi:hypothetical protein
MQCLSNSREAGEDCQGRETTGLAAGEQSLIDCLGGTR